MPYIKPLDFEEEIRQYRSLHLPPLNGQEEVTESRAILVGKGPSNKWTRLPAISSNGCLGNSRWQRKKLKQKVPVVSETQQEKEDAQKDEQERARRRKRRFRMAGMETKSYVIFSDESGKNYNVIEEETRPSTVSSFTPEMDQEEAASSLRFMRDNEPRRAHKDSKVRKKTQRAKPERVL